MPNPEDDSVKPQQSQPTDGFLRHTPIARDNPLESIATQFSKSQRSETSFDRGLPSQQIGPYKLLKSIGEGGMGSVWMAEQTEPIRRLVALKLIKTEIASKPVIARFDAERQALALMDHPSIAKILDGGETEFGQPYFVMELVDGIPMTQYCDQHRLGLPERLELFTQVCNAVHHAHQKGIIHRDLKPANILVGVYDGKPVPKVIDFGLAKALDHQLKLTDKTLFTEFGAVVGTLQYMSPEQADLDAIDIDTRADIYALGVLLYELLTGSTPIEIGELKQLALLKVLESIRETDPPRPSARLSSSSHQLPAISGNRKIDPSRLQSELRGDLDWIVMKALEKDRSRRYESASGFAADIERYLTDQPVVARPPTTAYTLTKFFKKNRRTVIAAGAMILLLVTGLIGTSLGLLEASRKTKLANENLARAESAEKETKARVKELEKITTFQTSQLSDIDVPMMGITLRKSLLDQFKTKLTQSGKSEDEVANQLSNMEQEFSRVNFVHASLDLLEENVFKRAEKVIENEYHEKPLLGAALLHAIGETSQILGDAETAERTTRKELEIRTKHQGPDHPDTLRAKNSLAVALNTLGNWSEALQFANEALEARRRILGNEHVDTLISISNVALSLQEQGNSSEAQQLHLEVLETSRRILGNEHPSTLTSINNMAVFQNGQGMSTDADPLYRECLEVRRRILGNDHPSTLVSINNLAAFLYEQDKSSEAEPLFHEVVETSRRVLGNEHPDTLRFINNLANFLNDQGKPAEAEPLFRESLEAQRRILGEQHPDTLISMNSLAMFLKRQGKLVDAETMQRVVLSGSRSILGREHPLTLIFTNNMANVLRAQGKSSEAEPLLLETLDASRRILKDLHPDTLACVNDLAELFDDHGNFIAAEPLLREAIQGFKDLPQFKSSHLSATLRLASLLNRTSRSEESMQLLSIHRNNLVPQVFKELMESYRQLGLREEGLNLLNEFVNRSRIENAESPQVLSDDLRLAARALNRMEEFSLAEPIAHESLELATIAKLVGWKLERVRSTLGVSLLGLGRKEEARLLLESSFEVLEGEAMEIPSNTRTETINEAKAAVEKLGKTEQ
jgi:eukaryotic-like serine/threonine-protein kinase